MNKKILKFIIMVNILEILHISIDVKTIFNKILKLINQKKFSILFEKK